MGKALILLLAERRWSVLKEWAFLCPVREGVSARWGFIIGESEKDVWLESDFLLKKKLSNHKTTTEIVGNF